VSSENESLQGVELRNSQICISSPPEFLSRISFPSRKILIYLLL
ncbi:unnamed protein product, partial [Gulo gulo]